MNHNSFGMFWRANINTLLIPQGSTRETTLALHQFDSECAIVALVTNIYAATQPRTTSVNTNYLLADTCTLSTQQPRIAAHRCRQYIATIVTNNQLLTESWQTQERPSQNHRRSENYTQMRYIEQSRRNATDNKNDKKHAKRDINQTKAISLNTH